MNKLTNYSVVDEKKRKELIKNFENYLRVKDECSLSGDWSSYSNLFKEQGAFVDHHGFGKFYERKGILEYITKSLAPFPSMKFFIDWVAFDDGTNSIVFQVQNAFPSPPSQPNGLHFQFPNWTRLQFEGPFLISEETVYNPLRDAGRTLKAWRDAGGKFQTSEQLKYQFSKYPKDKAKL